MSITDFFRESIDNKKFCYSCFIDLKKAFDTVDRKILLDKLYQYGFRGKIHKLMTNYLTGRKQYVYSNQSVSNMVECTKGVPQGSVLGPFLFLLYINDIPSASNVKLTLFADDTTVVDAQKFASKTKFQTELNKICKWCNNNKLLINQKKCKIMKFGRDNLNEKFSFGNNVLTEVSDFRCLGIQMDNRLKFECHINKVCGKLAKFNGLLFKGRNYFSKNMLVKFYNCYAKPLISYGLIAFGATSKSLLEKIFVMQKRIFKTICFKRKFEHASYILHSFEIDTVFDLYFRQIFKETFNQLRGKTPLETFNLESLNNRRVTRASVAKTLPSMKTRTQIMQRSWKNVSLKCYNFLKSNELIPDNLNQLTEQQLNGYFKKLFSLFLKDNGDLLDLFF